MDNRRSVIWNFLERNTEFKTFLEGEEEILTDVLNPTVIDDEIGAAYFQTLQRYPKEKELVYASLFVMGWHPVQGDKLQKICTPLLTHRAEVILKSNDGMQRVVSGQQMETHRLDENFRQTLGRFQQTHPKKTLNSDVFAFLSVDRSESHVNQTLLKAVTGDEILGDQVWNLIHKDALNADAMATLARLLNAHVPHWDCSALALYPQLYDEKQVRHLWHQLDVERDKWFVFPASIAAIVPKSVETRGVLSELAALGKQTHFSPPMKALFENVNLENGKIAHGNAIAPQKNTAEVLVPAILSDAQHKIIDIARISPLSLIVGPPGTGKSFTIASLAIEHLSRGETVLIASKMNQAVDVISDKIEAQIEMKNVVVRGGRKQYLSNLKKHLEHLLQGVKGNKRSANPFSQNSATYLKSAHRHRKQILKLEGHIRKKQLGLQKWASDLQADGKWIKKKYVEWRIRRKRFMWQQIAELEALYQVHLGEVRNTVQSGYYERLGKLLHQKRGSLTTFLKALRARESGKQVELFGSLDLNTILHAFPVWLVNLTDIYKVLPFDREMFDLAIIDEATQCDIATCLPILQRAKRVIIVGDPHQLRHISFLAQQQQQQLRAKYALPDHHDMLDFRRCSILDVAQDTIQHQNQVVFLDEHYRSVPSIIRFSNAQFYDNALHVMTEKPHLDEKWGVFLHQTNGQRDAKGINKGEASELIAHILHVVEAERDWEDSRCSSMGVLSPFRDQIDYLNEELSKRLPPEAYSRHQIMTGTAHTFQGEERDQMFLSFCLDDRTHPTAFRYLSQPDVLNVSITRARKIQHIFLSFDASALSGNTLVGQYLRDIQHRKPHTNASNGAVQKTSVFAVQNGFAQDVKQALEHKGFEVWMSYPLAGNVIDLVAVHNGKCCGIDLIDGTDGSAMAMDLEQYRMFQRVGLPLIPLSFPDWQFCREDCLAHIEGMLRLH
jgi:hypothetical protein